MTRITFDNATFPKYSSTKVTKLMNEQKLLGLIRTQLAVIPEFNWETMCKLRLNRQSREIDVLVGIPRLGLFILELKGWRNIGVESDGRIFKTDSGRRTIVKDPYVQLAAEISAMSEFLRTNFKTRPTVFGAVVYSGLSGTALRELTSNAPNIFPAELSISLDELADNSGLEEKNQSPIIHKLLRLATIESERHRRPHHKNDEETIRGAFQVLRKEVEVDFLDLQIKEITDAIESNSQYSIDLIKSPLAGVRRLHVTGSAGTGKTVLALSIAHQCALTLNSPSLYLCFSQNLRDHIIKRRSGLLDPQVWIDTPETLYERLTGQPYSPKLDTSQNQTQLSDLGIVLPHDVADDDRLYVCEDRIWVDILNELETQKIRFASVCIDEGQDFWGPLYEVLDEQTHQNGTFAVFADEHQTTRKRATFIQYQTNRPGFLELNLRVNLRNSPAVARSINKEFAPLIEYQVNDLVIPGEPPRKHEWSSYSELWNLLENIHTEIKRTKSSDVTVLFDSQCASEIVDILQKTSDAYGYQCYSVDDFKGLESDIVIVVTSHRDAVVNSIEGLWKQRYVAFSRARALLFVLQEAPINTHLSANVRSKKQKPK